MRMKLQRLLRVAPLALLFASVASAQTTGNIIGVVTDAQSGKPIVGALVVATSPSSQGEQTAITDKAGGFRFQLLQPGDYKLATSFDGFKPAERADLTVRVDKTIRANLSMVPEAVQMEEQVVRTGAAPVINVGSAEAGSLVSREFLSNIPVGRTFEGVAVTSPTAQTDRYGISFAGASSPENGYLIDGLNVGDTAYGTNGTTLLNNFIQEIDIKTGSFMPEYGFSTGGIVSVVTKSGSNEFHGSVFGNLTPGALQADGKSIGRDAEALASKLLPKDGTYRADFGFEVGGPILKDRLWFYAGFAPQLTHNTYSRYQQFSVEDPNNLGNPIRDSSGLAIGHEIAGSAQKITNKITAYQMVGKLTYLFNENNQLSVSAIVIPTTSTGFGTANAALSASMYDLVNSSTNVVARFSSKLFNKRLQLEVTGGYHSQTVQNNPVTTNGIDGGKTSQVWWAVPGHSLGQFETLGAGVGTHCDVRLPGTNGASDPGYNPCGVTDYLTGGSGYIADSKLSRLAGKLGLTYFAEAAGSHQLKAGLDLQRSRYDHTWGFTGPNALDGGGDFLGGASLMERSFALGSTPLPNNPFNVALAAANPGYPRWFLDYRRLGSVDTNRLSATDSPGGKTNVVSETTNAAFYLQDSWQPGFLDGLTINAGIRWETQSMGVPDQPGAQSLSINTSIAPRLQAVYDWTRQGRSKLAASWGRFFSSFPLDMADRAFADLRQISAYRFMCQAALDALAPGTDKSALAGAPESCAIAQGVYSSSVYGRYTYTPAGASSTPVAPNIKAPYVDMFGGQVEYEVFTDFSIGFDYQGRRQGFVIEDMSVDDGTNYAIANPGAGKPFPANGGTFDPTTAVSVDPITGRTFTTPFPKPVRSYDGFTFLVRKNFSNNWLAQASYTYSSLRGNYPGFFRPETGQLDPGITSMFDLASLLANQSGPLPGDQPHSFKAYGSYTFDFGPRLQVSAGAALRVTSGIPVNYLIAHPSYGPGEGYGLPRGSAGRTGTVTNFDLKGGLAYTITPPYQIKFTVDLFNILNQQTATAVDENWTFDSTQPIVNGQCGRRNAAGKANPIGAALSDCPSLAYMRTTDGLPVTINTNFARPTAYQLPLSVRFGLELTF
jgi:Carboxypeptidase regulatory-like domain